MSTHSGTVTGRESSVSRGVVHRSRSVCRILRGEGWDVGRVEGPVDSWYSKSPCPMNGCVHLVS